MNKPTIGQSEIITLLRGVGYRFADRTLPKEPESMKLSPAGAQYTSDLNHFEKSGDLKPLEREKENG